MVLQATQSTKQRLHSIEVKVQDALKKRIEGEWKAKSYRSAPPKYHFVN
jgi:hypothetical protein